MELTNKRTQYTVTETAQGMKLTGELSINEAQGTFSLNGSFQGEDNMHIGGFNYSQRSGEMIDKNLNNVKKENVAAAEALLASVVAQVNAQLENK